MKTKHIFTTPLFKIVVTVVLVLALAVFYKFAVSDYGDTIKKDLETLDTGILSEIAQQPKTIEDAMEVLGDVKSNVIIDRTFLSYCYDNIDNEIYDNIIAYLAENDYSDDMWKSICGYSALAIYDLSSGLVDIEYVTVKETGNSLSLAFVGDISLDSNWNWSPLSVFAEKRSSLLDAAFASSLSQAMLGSDMLFANLESPITDSTSKLAGLTYAHLAKSSDAEILGMLGIDIVNIANEHIYDYSATGLTDTLAALENAGVLYTGGGRNSDESSAPRYLIAGGRKIAYVSASYTKTRFSAPSADANNAGITYMTNSNIFANSIADASENADYVIVYADFGDNTPTKTVDDTTVALAHSFIDAGADIVLGSGISTLQPIENYNDKPIIYSLGMFWYETDAHEALMIELSFENSPIVNISDEAEENNDNEGYTPKFNFADKPIIKVIPCIQDGASTRIADGDAGVAIFNKIISEDSELTINENGYLVKK